MALETGWKPLTKSLKALFVLIVIKLVFIDLYTILKDPIWSTIDLVLILVLLFGLWGRHKWAWLYGMVYLSLSAIAYLFSVIITAFLLPVMANKVVADNNFGASTSNFLQLVIAGVAIFALATFVITVILVFVMLVNKEYFYSDLNQEKIELSELQNKKSSY